MLPSPTWQGLGLRVLVTLEATCAFTSVTARRLAHRPKGGFVDGLQIIRFPSCLPSKLQGLLALAPGGTSTRWAAPAFAGRTPSTHRPQGDKEPP